MAYAAIEAAKLAKGEKFETTKTMKAFNKEIPFIFIEPKVVDKSNLWDVVKDGAETEDECMKRVKKAIKNARSTNPLKR